MLGLHCPDASQHQILIGIRRAGRHHISSSSDSQTVHRLFHLTRTAKTFLRRQQQRILLIIIILNNIGLVFGSGRPWSKEEIPIKRSDVVRPLLRDEPFSQ